MSQQQVILTDVANQVWVESLEITSEDGSKLAGSSDWSISKYRMQGGRSDGIDVVTLNNGRFAVSVLPTRGMGLWVGEIDGIEVGWNSPVELPVHPKFVNQAERGGLGWLAGFNEWMCRCGLAWNGPPGKDTGGSPLESDLTLHGRIANLPAHFVEVIVDTDGDGSISVTGIVDEAMLFGSRLRLTSTVRMEAGANSCEIRDEVANLGGQPAEIELLYHTNIGDPFLEAGSRVLLPARLIGARDERSAEGLAKWDVCGPPEAGFVEQAYFAELLGDIEGTTQVLLMNESADLGLSLQYSVEELPCFTLWKNTRSQADGYVTGLEPGTNYPNFRSHEREMGRVITLAAGETYSCGFEVAVHTSAAEVAQVAEQIEQLQRTQPLEVVPGVPSRFPEID